MYSINDKVTLSAARGGWDGFVTEIINGPGTTYLYRVCSADSGNLDEGNQLVSELDIAGLLDPPDFSLSQNISLYGRAGIITAVNGDTFDIEVEWNPNEHMTLTRTHASVPLWRVAIENRG